MRLSTRYGWLGIGALVFLTMVQWGREQEIRPGPAGDDLLGSLPNLAAAIALTFVALSAWTAARQDEVARSAAMRMFLICAAISGIGLLAWELVQTTSQHFVFDINDIAATAMGLLLAGAFFRIVMPRAD